MNRIFNSSPFWRYNFDFVDLDYSDFEKFENIYTLEDSKTLVRNVFDEFVISEHYKNILASFIFNYGYGKYINKKDIKHWFNNFNSDLGLYLLELARYLQAYFRDVNKNIDVADIENITTDKKEKHGNTTTSKNTDITTNKGTSTNVADSQSVSKDEGNTLTVLNTTSTSTNYLANSTDEAYSKGNEQETTSTDISQNFTQGISNNINDSILLGASNEKLTNEKSGILSPLTIAKSESEFNFLPWVEKLKELIDSHLLAGGFDYA